MVLLGLGPTPEPPPEGTPPAHFFAAFGPTGYLSFVKVCEVVGGLLVAIPRTRNLGLLVLGPVIVNILAFHLFGPVATGCSNDAAGSRPRVYLLWASAGVPRSGAAPLPGAHGSGGLL